MANSIATARVTDRRSVRFSSIPDLMAELDRIDAADREGTLRTSGNWTPGQILAHLASWIEYGYTGYPLKRPPWFIRWLIRIKAREYLTKGMPAGVRIPGVPDGTYGQDPVTTAEGLARLRAALQRLQSKEPVLFDSPAFGKMSHDDRIMLNLRHAELHLSFLRFSDDPGHEKN